MAVKGRRTNSKNPPILSHEFIIQNHADIVACIAMVFVIGLIFQVSAPIASIFIAVQHNTTRNATAPPPPPYYFDEQLYTVGWKDSCCVFFYTLIAVVIHALVQEYVLDRFTRKLHLSKIKHSKFNDAGQLLAFSLITTLWGTHIVQRENYLSQISLLWDGFPHMEMSFVLKFFMLIQLSYWLHWIPEVYFLRMKKEEIMQKLTMASIYTSVVAVAYVANLSRVSVVLLVLHFIPEILLNFARLFHFAEKINTSVWLFRLGNSVFIVARFLSVIFAVLTFWFGLEPFASQVLRTVGLAFICGIQSYMLFQFCIFHVKRLRAHSAVVVAPPKSPKKVKKPKDLSDLPEVDQNTRKQAATALKQKKLK
ncbi:translocating chain-associated membrane protein 1 [Folsomia candida]|nr:translocating chain-associated membrane protein 1 [Folsomia candida]